VGKIPTACGAKNFPQMSADWKHHVEITPVAFRRFAQTAIHISA
jgi:hypothetical protein